MYDIQLALTHWPSPTPTPWIYLDPFIIQPMDMEKNTVKLLDGFIC